jgi:hypothetical protein
MPRPAHLSDEWYWMHSVDWWRRHWERYPETEVELAEALPGGWDSWVRWLEFLQVSGRATRPQDTVDELGQVRADGGRYVGFVRMVGRRKSA